MTRHPLPVVKVLVIGPTSAPWVSIAAEVEADLARLSRHGVEIAYRCTGAGPAEIRSDTDALAAAPFVVQTAIDSVGEGFDALIIDCTADPGLADACAAVRIPVIGAGAAMEAAIARAPQPVCTLSGDDLRSAGEPALLARVRGSATVALGGTGFSNLADVLAREYPGVVVLDPLAVALDAAVAACRS
ncbi:MAG: aspartate/glutamate racemase family protein [Ilumatobacteraceae bacterium]